MKRKVKDFTASDIIAIPFFLGALWKAGFFTLIRATWYIRFFALDMGKIADGELWRLVTFIMRPSGKTILWSILSIMIMIILCRNLEEMKGQHYVASYFVFSCLVQILLALVLYCCFERIVWLDLSLWWITLIPLMACIDPRKKVYVLMPKAIRVVWLLPLAALMVGLKMIFGTNADVINAAGQASAAVIWMMRDIVIKNSNLFRE